MTERRYIVLPGLVGAIVAQASAVNAATITEVLTNSEITVQYDEFGTSVAISGTTGVVGARRDDDNGELSGSAYLFDTKTGSRIAKLTADDATEFDEFGDAVAISGTIAIVGATGDDDGVPGSGSAYLFDATTGTQIGKLNPEDSMAFDAFGVSVGISGTTAIVGSSGDGGSGQHSGSAYLFDTTTGAQIAKLTPDDGTALDHFGRSVAIFGTTAIVGAHGDDDAGADSGSAYLFDTVTGNQIAKLNAEDAGAGDKFGASVAIHGTTAIVGAFFDHNGGGGSAYLFDTLTGNQIGKLTASDSVYGDFFGYSVGISDTTAIVGAWRKDDFGAVYLFDTLTRTQTAKLTAPNVAPNQNFGISVGISGTTALIGAGGFDLPGAAFAVSPAPPAVPLPAGIWLLTSAFGLMAFKKTRSQKAA